MKQKSFLKWFGGLVLTGLLVASGFYFTARGPIIEFDEKRDLPAMLDMFYQDWWWLESATPEEYDPAITFRTRSPNSDVYYQGKLKVKVIYDGDKLAGFVAYYKKSFFLGQLLFLDVNKEFRRKGYGEKLARYAINDMFNNMGIMRIFMYARPNNKPALALYDRLGFKEVSRDETFITMELYNPKN